MIWGHYIASVISLIRVSKFEHMSLIKTTLEGMIGAHKHTALGINYFPAPHISVDQLTKFSLPLLLKSDLKKNYSTLADVITFHMCLSFH